jgi:ABC-type transporter Mla subunit MlaD
MAANSPAAETAAACSSTLDDDLNNLLVSLAAATNGVNDGDEIVRHNVVPF